MARLLVDSSGTVFFADLANNRIRQIVGATIHEVAGADHAQGDGGKTSAATLYFPQGVARDVSGNFYIADTFNNEIRKVNPDGTISTLAKIVAPNAVVVDASGNVFVSHTNQIVQVDSKGNVTAVAGGATAGFSGGPAAGALLNSPFGLTAWSAPATK